MQEPADLRMLHRSIRRRNGVIALLSGVLLSFVAGTLYTRVQMKRIERQIDTLTQACEASGRVPCFTLPRHGD